MIYRNNVYGNGLGFTPFDTSTPSFNPSGGTLLLKGKVTDMDTNKPLSAAHVYYTRNGVKTGVITNLNGEYELQALPTDLITISFMGYKPIEAYASEIQKVEYLEPKLEELKEIVVTAPNKTKDNTMLYVGVGLLVLAVIAAASKKNETNNIN